MNDGQLFQVAEFNLIEFHESRRRGVWDNLSRPLASY